MHSFGYRPVRVNDFSATCGKVTWQSEGEHCASVGYPYSLVKEWVGSWAGWRWCADRIYQLQLWYRHVFIFCLCCDRINIVHLNVSKVICVGLARLEITRKQVLVLLFCNLRLQYRSPNKMHMLQSLFYLTIPLHVSGIIITHLQEHKPTLTTASGKRYPVLSVAIVEELELICVSRCRCQPCTNTNLCTRVQDLRPATTIFSVILC